MTHGLFFVTYDMVTPESAEHGDIADSGYVHPHGAHITTHNVETLAEHNAAAELCSMRLRDAVQLLGVCETSDGLAYYECDGRQNYQSGESTRYALHLPQFATQASVARVARIMQAKRLV